MYREGRGINRRSGRIPGGKEIPAIRRFCNRSADEKGHDHRFSLDHSGLAETMIKDMKRKLA